jgi:hypothetical protein
MHMHCPTLASEGRAVGFVWQRRLLQAHKDDWNWMLLCLRLQLQGPGPWLMSSGYLRLNHRYFV